METVVDVLGRSEDGELTEGRDFAVYARGMDVGLALKLDDVVPHLRPGLVVDKGCGTGALLAALASEWAGSERPGSRLVGVDLSKELLARARNRAYARPVEVLRGDVRRPSVEPGTADSVVLSSVLHEVYSYSGYSLDAVRDALRAAATELRPGGRLVVRDGVAPARGDALVVMALSEESAERFARFAVGFRPASEHPGVPHRRVGRVQGWEAVELTLTDAAEFLSKKDYVENWDCEVQEAFCYATTQEWEGLLADAGLAAVELREYTNPWILTHRYEGAARLHDAAGRVVPFPPTTCVVVGEKH